MEAKKNKKIDHIYLFIGISYFILLTIKTFLVEETWFDYFYYFFCLVAIIMLTVLSIKEGKKISVIILCIVFVAYIYGFNSI
jgi:hypothetical protein